VDRHVDTKEMKGHWLTKRWQKGKFETIDLLEIVQILSHHEFVFSNSKSLSSYIAITCNNQFLEIFNSSYVSVDSNSCGSLNI
jgi:hypothetical protein